MPRRSSCWETIRARACPRSPSSGGVAIQLRRRSSRIGRGYARGGSFPIREGERSASRRDVSSRRELAASARGVSSRRQLAAGAGLEVGATDGAGDTEGAGEIEGAVLPLAPGLALGPGDVV